MTTIRERPPSAVRRHRRAYRTAAVTYLTLQAFVTVPSPLYGMYAARDGLSPFTITLVYAAYAVGVGVSLILAGHLSDVVGRRPLLVVASTVAAASAVLLAVWPDLPGLFIARVTSGLAVGMTASTATAYLRELFVAHRPAEKIRKVHLLSAGISIGGLGVGALLAGALAGLPHPLVTPYIVVTVVFVMCVCMLLGSPETRARADPMPSYRPQTLAVPEHARTEFTAALVGVATVFAVFGLFVGLASTLLAHGFGRTSPAISGATLFGLFGFGVLCTAATARLTHRRIVAIGQAGLLGGLVLLVLSIWLPHPSLAMFVVSGCVIGTGGAALFGTSLTAASTLAPPERLAETLATFFLTGYLGLSLPVVAIGVALRYLSPQTTLLGFAIAVSVCVVLATPVIARSAGHDRCSDRG